MATAAGSPRQSGMADMPGSGRFRDLEREDAVGLADARKRGAGRAAEGLEILRGTRIGRQHAQRAAGRQRAERLLRAQHGQRAVQAFDIKGRDGHRGETLQNGGKPYGLSRNPGKSYIRAMSDLPVHQLVALWAFAAGIAFGAIAQRTNFCTMGALSDILFLENYNRMRAWLLAMAVAIAGSQMLDAAGLVDLGKSIYLAPNLGWLGGIAGGLMFGFGMTLAGGCGSRTLVRLGAGNLKSLIVFIVLGLFAYMTLRGLTGALRVATVETASIDLKRAGLATQGLPEIAGKLGIALATARTAIAGIAVAALGWYCFKDAAFRASPRDVVAGIGIGLLVVAGWAITGIVGNDDFEPAQLASFTFVAPIGDALVYAITWSGAKINFGIAGVLGVVVGAFLAARASGEFRVESFNDKGDLLRHLSGAALMGAGGVTALGCTIGQGITGLSTLAAGSVIAILAILAGGVLGLRYLEEGTLSGALKAVFARA